MTTKTAPAALDVLIQAVAGLPAVTASELKNNFGEASLRARKGAVAITRHNRAEFVLLPVEHYVELQQARQSPLEGLAGQFDTMVAKMNAPAGRRGAARLFKASPAALGRAAAKAAKAHG